jgi:hypothetical protein
MPIFTWELQKQIDDQVMVFAPKLFSETAYVTDMFHAMGCYFIMERGAANKLRDPCICSFVFPDLHSKRSDYVAKALSAALKKVLRRIIPSSLRIMSSSIHHVACVLPPTRSWLFILK